MQAQRKDANVADDPIKAEHAAEILKAVAHPLRLRIVALLCQEELHVNAIAERLDKSPAIISQQLRILRMNRLVEASREDGLATYRLAEPQLRDLVRCIAGCHRT
ncbi:MAG: winged helix-turn-helix transcriptional regulator [Deltaproteobacteria bacterium]|nr:winged helix-turn-helix transcriptional regulator [Deltaproteobacteria bacterium]